MARSIRDVKKTVVMNRRIVAAVLIGCSIPLITYLQRSTASGNQPLHSIYAELHYIPLLLAALIFGFRGAVLSSLMVFLLYGAYMVTDWHGASLRLVDNSIHIIFPPFSRSSSVFLWISGMRTGDNWSRTGTCLALARRRQSSCTI